MVKTLKLDEKGDIAVEPVENGGYRFAEVEGAEAIAQSIRIDLATWLGEDAFHPEVGLPVPSMVGAKNRDFIQGVILDRIKKRDDVRSVGRFLMEHDPNNEGVVRIEIEFVTQDGTSALLQTAFGGHH